MRKTFVNLVLRVNDFVNFKPQFKNERCQKTRKVRNVEQDILKTILTESAMSITKSDALFNVAKALNGIY